MKAALLGDPIAGAHPHMHGEEEVQGPISGEVTSASPNVRFDGVPVARQGDTTSDACCCHPETGSLVNCSLTVRANGLPIAYAMQDVQSHGTAALSGGGSTTVNIA